MRDVGALVYAERLRRGLTQEDLAALLGLTRQRLNALEQGAKGIAAEVVFRSLADLGVTLTAVPAGAPAEDFGRRIAELWSDPERYKAMVRAARGAFEQRLNWDAWGEKARLCLEQAA